MKPSERLDRLAQEEAKINRKIAGKPTNWWFVFGQLFLAGACLVVLTMLLGRGVNLWPWR